MSSVTLLESANLRAPTMVPGRARYPRGHTQPARPLLSAEGPKLCEHVANDALSHETLVVRSPPSKLRDHRRGRAPAAMIAHEPARTIRLSSGAAGRRSDFDSPAFHGCFFIRISSYVRRSSNPGTGLFVINVYPITEKFPAESMICFHSLARNRR